MSKIIFILTIVFGLFSTQSQAFDVFHPIRSAEKALVVGAVGYVGVKAATDYLINHPEKTSEWFSMHPEQLVPVTEYIDKKIENAQTQQEYDKYNNVKQTLILEPDILEEITLINDPIYKSIERDVVQSIAQTDDILIQNNKMPTQCNINVIAQLIKPSNDFENNINVLLPQSYSQTNKTYILDVNTYKKLKKGYRNTNKPIVLQQDHIPSYAAIEKFLTNHGIAVNNKVKIINGIQEFEKDTNLEANSTAIAVPEKIHFSGRTFGKKNLFKDNLGKVRYEIDAENLLNATIKDIATTAYKLYVNQSSSQLQYNVSPQDYIKSAMIIYERNKIMCMYDVQ